MNWARESWVKLYKREEGSFARLPLVARGIADEILKIVDSDGRIEIGDEAIEDVIAFRLGATRSDRRALRSYVPMLLADGFMQREDRHLVVVNFIHAQREKATTATATKLSPKTHEPTMTEPRPCNESTTMVPRLNHDGATTVQRNICNSLELFKSPCVEEKRGEEKRREEKEPPKPPRGVGPGFFDSVLADFGEAWKSKYQRSYTLAPSDKPQLGRYLTNLSREDVSALPAAFGRYIADVDPFVAKQGHSLTEFCRTPNKWLALRAEPIPIVISDRRFQSYDDGETAKLLARKL